MTRIIVDLDKLNYILGFSIWTPVDQLQIGLYEPSLELKFEYTSTLIVWNFFKIELTLPKLQIYFQTYFASHTVQLVK